MSCPRGCATAPGPPGSLETLGAAGIHLRSWAALFRVLPAAEGKWLVPLFETCKNTAAVLHPV